MLPSALPGGGLYSQPSIVSRMMDQVGAHPCHVSAGKVQRAMLSDQQAAALTCFNMGQALPHNYNQTVCDFFHNMLRHLVDVRDRSQYTLSVQSAVAVGV
jgi:hypothetical protein